MRITIGWFLAAALIIGGCGGDVRASIEALPQAEEISGNEGFAAYIAAAGEVEDKASKHISRTAWTPDQRDFIVQASEGAIRKLSTVDGVYLGKTWEEPFGVRSHTRGWRTIGRALAWRTERAVKEGNYADARLCLTTAMRMSNALATSDSHDAGLGLEIVDECLRALWPALPRFEPNDLNALSKDVIRLLGQDPGTNAIVDQERALLLAQVEWVRDSYQERDFDTLSDTLGKAVEPAVKYLRELAEAPAEEQQEYFDAFAAEVEEEIDLLRQKLSQSPAQWASDERKPTRAWMRFTDAFCTPWRMYVERRAQVRTRLRLLAIDAALLGQFKSSREVANDLSNFPENIRTDPYTGRDLVYVPRGVDYKLYSVGEDRADNGGDRGDITPDR